MLAKLQMQTPPKWEQSVFSAPIFNALEKELPVCKKVECHDGIKSFFRITGRGDFIYFLKVEAVLKRQTWLSFERTVI